MATVAKVVAHPQGAKFMRPLYNAWRFHDIFYSAGQIRILRRLMEPLD